LRGHPTNDDEKLKILAELVIQIDGQFSGRGQRKISCQIRLAGISILSRLDLGLMASQQWVSLCPITLNQAPYLVLKSSIFLAGLLLLQTTCLHELPTEVVLINCKPLLRGVYSPLAFKINRAISNPEESTK